MTVLRGFVVTILSGLGFAAFGGIAGYALGRFVPDYYSMVFRIQPADRPGLPLLGAGLGMIQGVFSGLVVGLVIVVTVALSQSRAERRSLEEGASPSDRPRQP